MHGTGTVYQRKRDGKWVAAVDEGWTAAGSRKRRTRLGQSQAEARRLLRAMLREDSAAPATAATVRTYADRWLTRIEATARPSTYTAHRSAIRQWIVPTIGRKRLSQLTPGDLRAVDRAVTDAGRSPATALRTRAVLGKMLRDAIEDRERVPLDLLEIGRPTAGESVRDTIPPADAARILATALTRADASRWIAALLLGLRPAEARGLTWAAITPDSITVEWQAKALPYRIPYDRQSGYRIPRGYRVVPLTGAAHLVRPKTGHGRRVIPMLGVMAAELQRWRTYAGERPHGLVWSDGTPTADKADLRAWRALCADAGVPAYDLYSARHSAATLLRAMGADDQTITRTLGHASILSSQPYLHADIEHVRAVLTAGAQQLGLPDLPRGDPPGAPSTHGLS